MNPVDISKNYSPLSNLLFNTKNNPEILLQGSHSPLIATSIIPNQNLDDISVC